VFHCMPPTACSQGSRRRSPTGFDCSTSVMCHAGSVGGSTVQWSPSRDGHSRHLRSRGT